MREILYVGAGSAIGGMLRYLVSRGIGLIFNYPFPLATLLINISGSFLIGYLYAASLKHPFLSSHALLFLVTGLCGGFTTFSAFSWENVNLIRNGQVVSAVIYMAASILIGVFAALGGYWAGK